MDVVIAQVSIPSTETAMLDISILISARVRCINELVQKPEPALEDKAIAKANLNTGLLTRLEPPFLRLLYPRTARLETAPNG